MKKITLLILIIFTIAVHGQNKLLSNITEYYDGTLWVNDRGSNYEYDVNNNLISETYLNWVEGAWQIRAKYNYTYNASNKIIEEFVQDWNPSTNMLENVYKGIYTYTNGKATEIASNGWIGNNWVFDEKYNITYNSNNLIEGSLSYLWDGAQWVNDYRYTTTYNANNKISQDLNENWISSQWVNEDKSLYTYDSNNKLVTVRSAVWDDFNNIWEETDRIDYELDVTGNRIRETNSYKDSNGNVYQSKEEYTYDSSMLMSSFANPFKDKTGFDYFSTDFPYVNKVLTSNSFSYNTITSSYENSSRTTYNYTSSITLGTKQPEIAIKKIVVFPNPSKYFIQVSGLTKTENFEVYSILGTKLNEGIITNNEKIDIQNLANGSYFLKFKNGDSIKFIKE